MTQTFARRTWNRVQTWFAAEAEHTTVVFLPDPDGEPVLPNAGYVRLWLAEGFLAQGRSWGRDHYPALHGGVSLNLLGPNPAAFTTFTRPPGNWTAPGAQLDFPMTALLPFSGGTVEVEAALYRASTDGPLGTALTVLGGLAPLLGPPLSTAAVLADKLSDGLDGVLDASAQLPLLGVHWTMVSAGGLGNVLRPGHLAVLAARPDALPGTPAIVDGRLHLAPGGGAPRLPDGVDYLVLRVECRTERDDWRLPDLDELVRAAGDELIRGDRERYAERRVEALTRAWNSVDLTPLDRRRVALLIQEELDALGRLGVVPAQEYERAITARQVPAADDDRLQDLTLDRLLAATSVG